jgi:isopentenyl-diphosphate Delta-isomerase
MNSDDEYVVLLNDAAQPVGRELKSRVHHARTPLHLAFSIFLFDATGRTLFQQRAQHKKTWPGVWSNACCGHPAPGETLASAAKRRLRDELGIATPVELKLALPHFRYRARWEAIWENEVCPVFVAAYEGPIAPNPTEVAAVRWIEWASFARACTGGTDSEFSTFSPWSRWEAAELMATSRFNAPEVQLEHEYFSAASALRSSV